MGRAKKPDKKKAPFSSSDSLAALREEPSAKGFPRLLWGFAALGTVALAAGASMLGPAADAYLLRLPENYRQRARAALLAKDFAGVSGAVRDELAVRPYNFEAARLLADLAVRSGDANLQREALSGLFRGFAAFEAVRGRDVYALGWSEGGSLRGIGRLLMALGRPGQSLMAWDAAAEADPAWTASERAAWLDGLPPEARAAFSNARPQEPAVSSERPQPPAGIRQAFEPAKAPSAAAISGGKLYEDAALLFSRGALTFPVPEGAPGGTLALALKGSPALDSWPFLLIEARRPGSPPEALGFVRADSAGWKIREVRLLRAPEPGETLALAYFNDAADALAGEDRNAWIGWAGFREQP